MEDEYFIRKEANTFFKRKLIRNDNTEVFERFKIVKDRLLGFYSNESKAIFLDEIQHCFIQHLNEHRIKAHNGEVDTTCKYENDTELFQFYIKQEQSILPYIANQRFPMNKKLRDKVFISYSHADKDYLNDIQRHFKPFLNQINYWDDTQIQAGQKWKEEIKMAIENAQVAILLVSTDFLGSDFISTHELPLLLESAEKDGTTILTIILKPCLFEDFLDLNKFQALNAPSNPVSKMDYNEKEELYVNLVRQTKRVLNKL